MFSHKSNFSQRSGKKENIGEKSNSGYLEHPSSTDQSSLYIGALREEGAPRWENLLLEFTLHCMPK